MGLLNYVDTILVPLSLFLTIGYHAYLWHKLKNNPNLTTIGFDRTNKREWLLSIIEDINGRKAVLGVQSIRNSLMTSILSAVIAVALNISLAALCNNTYNARHLLQDTSFGSLGFRNVGLKYSSSSLLLLISFLCSSMAVGYLNEASFLVNASGFSPGHVLDMFERGCFFSLIGIRALYMTFPLLLWMLGPVPMALSSVATIWMLYGLDFTTYRNKDETYRS